MLSVLEKTGTAVIRWLGLIGEVVILVFNTFRALKKPPRMAHVVAQMAHLGVDSLPIVTLTLFFTGAVMTLQIATEFIRFGAQSTIGGVVAIAICRELGPVLVGVVSAGRVGAAITAEISTMKVTEQIDALRVMVLIILTVHDSSNYALDLLRIGAHGYLLKDVEPAALVKAIHAVMAGQTFIHPIIMERIFGTGYDDRDLEARLAELWRNSRGRCLTEREMDVLACIAKGFSNQDIAAALFVSEKTVKNHLTNIFRKLGVNDRTQALLCCLKRKIITLD